MHESHPLHEHPVIVEYRQRLIAEERADAVRSTRSVARRTLRAAKSLSITSLLRTLGAVHVTG